MSRYQELPPDLAPTSAISRRTLLAGAAAGATMFAVPRELRAALAKSGPPVPTDHRFPHFQAKPVSYLNVEMQDDFWEPRQKTTRDVTLAWATGHIDKAGGLQEFRKNPPAYRPEIGPDNMIAIEFIEALAAATGAQRDPAIEGLALAWGQKMIDAQAPDGYWLYGWSQEGADPAKRWRNVWWSHEDFVLGHFLESAIGFREATGNDVMYRSAKRAADTMAAALLDGRHPYATGVCTVEQALMRLYGVSGDPKYLHLAGWLIGQRGHHEGRPSYGKYSQDDIPFEQQRTIEGHAVRAAYLYNGATEYVGATGHAGYREAVLAIWDDFVNHKMYLHGAGGITSMANEGYSSKPDFIPPGDCYGESCSVFGNFQWAHNLFHLTGDASYLDVAERMLYNAFYASLSLSGDRYFYENVAQQDRPTARFAWHVVPCCPPNITKLFFKVGGFFYSTDERGIFVKHYGASAAQIPFAHGVKLTQRTQFPWDGDVKLQVDTEKPARFALRLRVPAWARSHAVLVNGAVVNSSVEHGWLVIDREWKRGDVVDLSLPMEIERITMPPRFKEYKDLVALQRGPLVYCLEEADMGVGQLPGYLPSDARITAEHRSDLLGGVTVLRATFQREGWQGESSVPATFIPYGVWNNRTPNAMSIWLSSEKGSWDDSLPGDPPGDTPQTG